MSKRTRRARFSFKAALFLATLALGIAGGQRAPAQQTPLPTSSVPELRKIYTNKREFHLPVKLPDGIRANLREMCLYVKTAQTDWALRDSIPPTAERFTPRDLQDGEYFFTVVTVDKNGRSVPADVRAAPPGLRVVVDTQPPQFDVRLWVSPEGESFLKCTMIDANPNPETIRLVVKNALGVEATADPHNGQPGLYRITGPEMYPLRVSGSDLAKNSATQEINVREVLGEKFAQAPAPAIRPELPTPPSVVPPVVSVPPDSSVSKAGYMPDVNQVPPINNFKNDFPTPPGKEATPPVAVPGLPPSLSGVGDNLPKIPAVSGLTGPQRQVIRTPHASIEYRIDQQGASGIGKVEVYVTADEGNTWRRLKEDLTKRSPVQVELPGEGLFGICVVVTNGNGFGGTPPKRGETPSFWVEVDTTSPFVQLRPIEVSPASGGSLEIRWTASDKNLSAEPVTLYYRTKLDGPWQMIATKVKNDGVYRWAIPRDVGGQFHFKVEATDQAGNVGRAETSSAVLLDMTEPRAVVIGVSGN